MSDSRYAVVYGGQFIKGVSRAQATRQFAVLYRIDEAKAADLLARKRLVLKHGLPEKLARRYQNAYAQAGVVTQIQLQKPTRVDPNPDDQATPDQSTTIMPAAPPPPRELESTTIQKVVDFGEDLPIDDGPVFVDPAPRKPVGGSTTIMDLSATTDSEADPFASERASPDFEPVAPEFRRTVEPAKPERSASEPDRGAATVMLDATGARMAAERAFDEQPASIDVDNLASGITDFDPTADAGIETERVDASREAPRAASAEPPADRVNSSTQRAVESVNYAFEFHGKAGEYFRIWIVNLALSILTLGIYSAWAKVRNLRYFYGNTEVAAGRFEFHGTPKAILIGRIIAVTLFLLYSVIANLMPLIGIPLTVVLLAVLPWMINRSLAFRYRNTSYRGLRFGFSGNYLGALMAFVVWPIAGALTFGLAIPYALFAQKRYIVGHASYGRSNFETQVRAASFYWFALVAAGIMVGAALLVVLAQMFVPFAPFVLLIPAYFYAFAYFQANSINHVFNSATLSAQTFESSLQAGALSVIYLTNALAVALTLGLALPWAKVRMARYRAEHLDLVAAGDLDRFVADQQSQVDAVGEELGDVFDLDLGL